uniref:Uncharacterized protein n=1 Tax=Anguilla anguilla TaxID=7936 RepID=A0A0E9P972_ANGAN
MHETETYLSNASKAWVCNFLRSTTRLFWACPSEMRAVTEIKGII